MKKRLRNGPVAQVRWVVFMACPERGHLPGGKRQRRVRGQQAWPDRLTAAAARGRNTEAVGFHGQLTARRFLLARYVAVSRVCAVLLVTQLASSLEPKLHAEVMSVLKLRILQRALLISS